MIMHLVVGAVVVMLKVGARGTGLNRMKENRRDIVKTRNLTRREFISEDGEISSRFVEFGKLLRHFLRNIIATLTILLGPMLIPISFILLTRSFSMGQYSQYIYDNSTPIPLKHVLTNIAFYTSRAA